MEETMKTQRLAPVAELRLSDFAAAALLIAYGCHLARLEKTNDPQRMAFVIRGDARLTSRLLDAYAHSEVTVRLDAYLSAQRLLKDRLFRAERTRAQPGTETGD